MFLKRKNGVLKERVEQRIPAERTAACSKVAISKFFEDVVRPEFDAKKFKPENMYNMDETMLSLDEKAKKVGSSIESRYWNRFCESI